MNKKIKLISLGCSKNLVDSEHLLAQVANKCIDIVPEEQQYSDCIGNPIDVVIINTCGFIKDAKEESINTILEAVEAKKRGYVKKIVVFGCLSQRYKEELEKEIPEVDAFFGAFDIKSVLEYIGILQNKDLCLKRYITTPSHYAYLKISEGCDRKCSYCAIPLIRGPHVSVPMEDLVTEAENLAAAGVKELIVIAQDTTYYGLDLYGERKLGELLRRLCKIEGIEWIRIHYSYPASFPKDVITVMAEEPKICKYLDIPLQHSSSKILKSMRRNIDAVGTQRLIDDLRKSIPDIVLRTTMIVGFPGEDNREFEKLLKFVQLNKFERLGAFTYSEEEGTYGAKKFKDTIRESTKKGRYDKLMEIQSEISYSYNKQRIGDVEEVIIDSYSDGIFTARSRKESPDVDGEIHINLKTLLNIGCPENFAPEAFIGNFAKIRIIGADEYDLDGEFIN
jgi:ribosomal protein S12 methylthiotransferase RimO